MTTPKYPCSQCPALFDTHPARWAHMLEQHPTPGQKSAKTRAANRQRALEASQQAVERMKAASERLIRSRSSDLYEMELSYRVNQWDIAPGYVRRPTLGALEVIGTWERAVESANAGLKAAQHEAWISGTPVTLEEVLTAQAAGEVQDAQP